MSIKLTKGFFVNGNLALKPSMPALRIVAFRKANVIGFQPKNYETPKIRKFKPSRKVKPIVMNCWQSSSQANDGDGC